ncbi:MAG: TonB-dependent receptor [Bacteroides sp.]|nr:TonB-dependent receptor [Bacteroides sp.]
MKKVSHLCLFFLTLLLGFPGMQVWGNTEDSQSLHTSAAQQQSRTVTGTVIDERSDEPLIGVNVMVRGASTGTITDLDGNFTLSVAGNHPVLVVSYMGYVTQNVNVTSDRLTIKLAEDAMRLDEVVVVGYGVQKKSLITGAIASVKGSDLEMTGIMRADDALQGKTPGVQVIANSGQPGTAMTVRIRGVGTNGTAQPIYIVDGMAVGDIEYLNPADIESIEVLKDAASAAIYGARGGNGVILVTTKKGSEGRVAVTANYSYGIQNLARKVNVLNAREYCIIQNEAARNGGQPLPFTEAQIAQYNKGTDWQEAVLYRNAPTQQAQITVSGGDAKSSFLTSASYFTQDGILAKGKSNFNRFTINLKADRKFFNDRLTIGENVSISRVERQSVTQNSLTAGPLVGALNMDPLTPVYDPYNPDPLYGGFGVSEYVSQEVVNPVARIHFSHGNSNYMKLIGGVFAELRLFKDFKFRSTVGTERTWEVSYGYSPIYRLNSTTGNTTANGASQSMENTWSMSYENVLDWAHIYGAHNVSALIGTSYIDRSATFMSGNRNDLMIDDEKYAYLSMATSTTPGVSGGMRNPSRLLSYFGRVNYSYDDRYMMTFTLRRDGSSRFGADNRFSTFPSVSVGWNLTNEQFLRTPNWLNSLKLRASWGQNGNENINDFQHLSTISTYGLGYAFGSQLPLEGVATGAAPTKVLNPGLKWETIEQTNVGVDVVLFNAVTLNLDYYRKTTKDLLLTSPTPLFLGNTFPTMNAGSVRNEGFEAFVSWKKRINKLDVTLSGNMAYNKNEVTHVGTYTGFVAGSTIQGMTGAVTRMEKGYPMAYFWGYKTQGIFQNQDEINAYIHVDENGNKALIQPNARPGDFRFQDTNGDGVIDDNDRVNLGNPYPDVTYGLNLNLEYRGFDLTVNTSGTIGNKIFSVLRRMDLPMSNYQSWALDRWHGEGTSNSIPRVTTNDTNQSWSRPSDFHVKDGSYFRIRNVMVGYTTRALRNYYIQSVRVYAAVNNLYTFTRYEGFDPEIGGGVLSTGVDTGVYPHPRTVSFGINVSF